MKTLRAGRIAVIRLVPFIARRMVTRAGICLPLLLGFTLLMGLGACCGLQPPRANQAEKPQTPGLRVGDMVDLGTGRVLSWGQFMDKVASARVLYLGEIHNSRTVHRFQQRVIEAFCQRREPVVVAMEMFTQEAQPVLDQWLQGKWSESRFPERVGWRKQWGYPFSLYRGILRTCKACAIPVVGINLPHGVVSKIARKGLDALGVRERAMVATHLDESREAHRRFVREEFKRHPPMGFKDFEAFYQAQLAWEETMARNIAGILERTHKATRIVVLVGKAHVEYRFGIPQRAVRRLNHTYKIVVPLSLDEIERNPGTRLADFGLLVAAGSYRHGQRAKLGVMVMPLQEGRYQVVRIADKSPAAAGGVKLGDILLRIDGFPIKEIGDIRRRLSAWSGYHTVLVRRGQRVLTIVVRIDNGKTPPLRAK